MRCIDRKIRLLAAALLVFVLSTGCGQPIEIDNPYDVYESPRAYGLNITVSSESSQSFFGKDLCVAGTEDKLSQSVTASLSEAAGLFDIKENALKFGKNIYGRVYPASTTKILTAYVALKHGDLTKSATVTEQELQLEEGSSTCGLAVGDTITLEELLYGLMLCSGNDAANVIADLVAGSTEKFAEMMNQEALSLGATNSHFINPHGLHSEEHYTTVYDMYLIFQAALQEEKFVSIISSQSHTASFTHTSGEPASLDWANTNKYLNGEVETPEGIQVMGGKTGTTNDAGYCLVLYSKNNSDVPHISIVYKAESRENLYHEMTELLIESAK